MALRYNSIQLVFAFAYLLLGGSLDARGQTIVADTIVAAAPVPRTTDSMAIYDSIRKAETRKVVLRSALLPGWGQISNRQAWKLPFVYAAIGVPVGIFAYNVKEYKRLRDAYRILADTNTLNDDQIPEDLKPISPNRIRSYRDQFRQYVDYSALAILVGWGLQVVDAAVFANLRDFDVSDDLSLQVRPNVQPFRNTYGLSLVLHPSNQNKKLKNTAR